MPFKRARFASFRNLEDGELGVDAERIFLIGENGQGKTNFLEALYYLCYGASFRGLVDSQIPAAGKPGFGLSGLWSGSGDLPDEEISVRVEGAAKDIRLNGKPLTGRYWITHRELTAGGALDITLGPQPNKQWGVPGAQK